MTLQQLRYIVMVAETGTITEAAGKLYISQPSLTNAIHELEKEMNLVIFNRTNKGITLSKEGDDFLGYARQVLEQAAILEAEARPESSKRDANARVMLAEASAEAIRRVASAVGTDTTPMLYMLGEKYIASLERMGSTDNAKVVVLPADLQEAVRGLVGGALKR